MDLARRLAGAGHDVTLLESGPSLGGLASVWTLETPAGPVEWDRHYHVTLTSDLRTRALLDVLGLGDELVLAPARAGLYAGGELRPCSSALDYVKLPSLSPIAKARVATTIIAGALIRDGRKMESKTITSWLRRWSGDEATVKFWIPLLKAKLGDNARDASAAFLWATVQRLFRARRQGITADLFGYVKGGGYRRTLGLLAAHLTDLGVTVHTSARVTAVTPVEGGVEVEGYGTFHQVVLTTASPIAAQLVPSMPADALARCAGVTYQGIVCASLLLTRPLSPYYLTYITDPAPFTAVVEMTSLVDPAELGGSTLVYLPRYVPSSDPWLQFTDEQVREQFWPALVKMHPDLTEDEVVTFAVSRVRYVLPVPTLNYSDRVPPTVLGPGIHLVSSAHITDGTLNADETLRLAEEAMPRLLNSRMPA